MKKEELEEIFQKLHEILEGSGLDYVIVATERTPGGDISGSLGYKTSDSFRSAAQCICNHAASSDGQASQAFISAIIGKMMEERMKSFSVKHGNTHLN